MSCLTRQHETSLLSVTAPHLPPCANQRLLEAWIGSKASERAGIDKPVSPHWMRHAHASHALDNGAPITLVRDTLGQRSVQVTSR